jgi:4-diphosphocytidyl-2C-methyl-D-erythritol kinase
MRALSRLRSGPDGLRSALEAGLLVNDLEPVARRLCPPVARLCEGLRGAGALGVGMSGSGATVFGVFSSEEDASAARSAAGFEASVWSRVARTGV